MMFFFYLNHVDRKVWHRRVKHSARRLLRRRQLLAGELALLGRAADIVEHADQGGCVDELGRETGPHHVVAVGHALNAVPGQVGVRYVRSQVHGLRGKIVSTDVEK